MKFRPSEGEDFFQEFGEVLNISILFSLSLSIYLSIYLSMYLSIYLYISISLSIYIYTHTYIHTHGSLPGVRRGLQIIISMCNTNNRGTSNGNSS